MNILLWIIQILLALLFLFAGGTKLVLSLETMAEMSRQSGLTPLPGLFVRFLGVVEVLGALGLILPGLLRIRPGLTPLAAASLVIIMIGATAITVASVGIGAAVMPLVTGLLAAFVAYGRWRLAPVRGKN
jgi:uncharacterized membrane protein YphA (DoxX/SURF4 family)